MYCLPGVSCVIGILLARVRANSSTGRVLAFCCGIHCTAGAIEWAAKYHTEWVWITLFGLGGWIRYVSSVHWPAFTRAEFVFIFSSGLSRHPLKSISWAQFHTSVCYERIQWGTGVAPHIFFSLGPLACRRNPNGIGSLAIYKYCIVLRNCKAQTIIGCLQ